MLIRPERSEEFDQIHELVKRAFETAQVSDGREQDFVRHLRSGDNYVPELALVAEEAGTPVGHIMLTRTIISGDRGEFPALLLGPVAVALEHRNRGVGSALIKESLCRARKLGHQSALLVGNPAYYHRFGFRTAADFGIGNANGIPDEYVMACELVPAALAHARGTILFETMGTS